MIFSRVLVFTLLIFLFCCETKKSDSDDPNAKKWISLFNGKDLDGWRIKIAGYKLDENFGNTFRVQDSILSIRYDQYDSFKNKFGALYYGKKFSNYRLKVEYRFVGETTPGAPDWGFRDSGVQYHSQSPESLGIDQSFPVCLEYNLHGGNGKDERPVGELCASGTYVEINGKRNETFCTLPTVKKTFHGDQWVTLEIDIQNGNVIHFVNGAEILRFENPHYDPNHEIAKSLISGDGNAISSGFISLQSNSHPIDFRKIDIMEY